MSLWILNWIWLGKETDVVADIEQQPSVSELSKALGELKSGKAGSSCFLVKVVGSDRVMFLELLLDLIYSVWEERQVPPDEIIIPVPKKGNLSDCNTWRGIALLEVIGKVGAKHLQQKSQVIAEGELPESQCMWFSQRKRLRRYDFSLYVNWQRKHWNIKPSNSLKKVYD